MIFKRNGGINKNFFKYKAISMKSKSKNKTNKKQNEINNTKNVFVAATGFILVLDTTKIAIDFSKGLSQNANKY